MGRDLSDNREPFLSKGKVDLVLASYSITPERHQIVGQTGPYLHHRSAGPGQAADSDIKGVADLKGKEVCSVTGSTSLENVKAKGTKPVGFDTYSAMRRGRHGRKCAGHVHRRFYPAGAPRRRTRAS